MTLPASPDSSRLRRADGVIALLLLLLGTLSLAVAGRSLGFTRDEGYYFTAAENHVGYLEESLQGAAHGRPLTFANRQVIDRWLGYNSEHPPLLKTLFGLSWRLLHRCTCDREPGLHPVSYPHRHRTLGLLSQGAAMRLPTQLLGGALAAAVYLFAALCLSRFAGLVAAALTLLQPRLFFHSQLSCFDAPVTAFIFLTTLAYLWACLAGDRRQRLWRGLVFAVVLAAAMLTKHNTFFLPPILVLHWLYMQRRQIRLLWRRDAASADGASWVGCLLPPWAVFGATLTPLLYLAGWPYLWPAPVQRFASYIGFHLHHVHYNIEYLGVNYNRPPYPWHYVPLMTLFTVPVTTLLLATIGGLAVRSLGRRVSPADLQSPGSVTDQAAAPTEPVSSRVAAVALILLSLAWPIAVIMRPGTPIFGAEKHWLPAVPFLALLAGVGAQWALDQLVALRPLSPRGVRWAAALLALLVTMPAAIEVARSHPYALTHYNALAGGPRGAADLGMNRHFWGYAVRGLYPTLNAEARPQASIYFHDANWNMLQMSMKDGLLRRDLRDSGMEEPGVRAADLGLVLHERHFNKYEYWLWDAFGSTRPLSVITHEGVPVATLYARPGAARSSSPESSQCPIAK
ncbi:MAG TPA: glycosyltransferase family 39 protein [Pseudomonadota bacterium]|nr:glycosyltransferase family 39 protein [Pseudomonadota bacterium]